jgi:hemerythrin-like domain-containing protein
MIEQNRKEPAMSGDNTRRDFMRLATAFSTGLLLTGCGKSGGAQNTALNDKDQAGKKPGGDKEAEVTATEDLMREHGVIRRVLLVYTAVAGRLREDAGTVSPDALHRAAKLFRSFGEDYHEKMLEEAYIFPAVRQAGGPAAAYADILTEQHQRGREITDYILAVTARRRLGPGSLEPMAKAMESLVLMYRNHAAREDTIVFPAWKQTMSADQLDQIGDKFEDIEQKQFGEDGFENAVKQIGDIESTLGLDDLAQFTAPPPPPASGG